MKKIDLQYTELGAYKKTDLLNMGFVTAASFNSGTCTTTKNDVISLVPSTYSVEDTHEFHESLCVTLFSRDALHLWFDIDEEMLQIRQHVRNLKNKHNQ